MGHRRKLAATTGRYEPIGLFGKEGQPFIALKLVGAWAQRRED
jgi:hypothetical protein